MLRILCTFIFLHAALFASHSKSQLLEIRRGIDKILSGIDQNVHIGIEVVSLESGLRLYEKSSHKLFVPASTIKLFVAGAALQTLGPEFTFETRLLTDGPIKGKVLHGNLYMQGSGDPSFTLANLEELTMRLRLLQIEEIQGDIIVDNYAFDNFPEGPGWMWDDIHGVCFVPMNALSINRNCLQVWVRPADGIAMAPKVFAYPKTNFVQIDNKAVTDETANTLTVERATKSKKNTIQVKGEIGLRSSLQSYRVPIKGPHLYAATLLESILKKASITCKGSIQVQKTPVHAEELSTYKSPPLSVLIQTMLKTSDNLYADNLFKKLGQMTSHEQGSWKNGSLAIRKHLEDSAQISISDLVLLDGSGLSRYNLVSPHHVTAYLTWVYRRFSHAPEFLSALSLAGRDGSLRHRMIEDKPSVRAKTGTMTGITALSGYVQTADGEPLAFSILLNGFTEKTSKYKLEVEDQICCFLAKLSK